MFMFPGFHLIFQTGVITTFRLFLGAESETGEKNIQDIACAHVDSGHHALLVFVVCDDLPFIFRSISMDIKSIVRSFLSFSKPSSPPHRHKVAQVCKGKKTHVNKRSLYSVGNTE